MWQAHRCHSLVLLVLLFQLCAGQLQPHPRWLQASSFSPATHPKQCPLGSLFLSAEQWWLDELFTGTVPPLGHLHLENCWPWAQVLPRQKQVSVDTLQHQTPAVTTEMRVRLQRPDGGLLGFSTPQHCRPMTGKTGAEDVLQCKRGLMRSSLTPLVCNRTGGTVVATYTLPPGAQDATSIDCRWRDAFTLDTTQVPASGNVQFILATRAATYSDPVPDAVTGVLSPRPALVEAFLPAALPDSTTQPCTGPWCAWTSPGLTRLSALAWTSATNYTRTAVQPLLMQPIGGIWRLSFTAFGPASSIPVSRNIITFDANFHAGNPGLVVRNATGSLHQQQLPLNLTSLGLTGGWHKLTVQGKAMDPVSKGVQTSSLSFFFEVVPPCPPSAAPFITHVWQDTSSSINTRTGQLRQTFGATRLILSPPTSMQQPYMLFQFDLSFMAPTGVTVNDATLFVHLANTNNAVTLQDSITLDVFDGSQTWVLTCGADCPLLMPADVPCVAPGCSPAIKIGTGTLRPFLDTQNYVELQLRPQFVSQHMGGSRMLRLAVGMSSLPAGATGAAAFSSSASFNPPFLMLSTSCGASMRRLRRPRAAL